MNNSPQLYPYNVTQTLAPWFYRFNLFEQLFKMIPNYKRVLDQLFIFRYDIYAEVTTNGNLHFHSQILSFLPPESFTKYYKVFTQTMGMSDIVHAKSEKQVDGWRRYMEKDTTKTLDILTKLSQFTKKGLPYRIKEITMKLIHIKQYSNFEKIFSNYKLYASQTTVQEEEHQTTQEDWEEALS